MCVLFLGSFMNSRAIFIVYFKFKDILIAILPLYLEVGIDYFS